MYDNTLAENAEIIRNGKSRQKRRAVGVELTECEKRGQDRAWAFGYACGLLTFLLAIVFVVLIIL